MADDVNEGVESALKCLVSVTERSCNLRNDLKKDILEAVSSLRNYFVKVQTNLEAKTAAHKVLEKQVKEGKDEIQRLRDIARSHTRQEAPSLDPVPRQTTGARQVLPPDGKARKLYAEVAKTKTEGSAEKRYRLLAKSKTNHSGEEIKNIIRTSINSTSMKVGICAFRSLRDGRVLLETKSKEEIELLHTNIKDKCCQLLDVNIQELRKPNIVIYNVPEEVTIENAEEIISTQNPELNLNTGDVKPKFIFRGKRNTRNLVIEVGSQTRLNIFNTKLKIGWHICNTEDYVVVNRCFKCSRYNHKASNCRGVETCPLCTGGHKLKECSASSSEYKCINCVNFNKYSGNTKVCENHSSLDKSCPSLQAVIMKYKLNTDY